MSQENVEIVRRLYEGGPELEQLIRADSTLEGHPWLSMWHPDCVLEELDEVPDKAAYRGRDGVVRYFKQAFTDVWEEWRFTPVEIVDGPEGVFATVDNFGRSKAGAQLELRIFQTFRIQDGKIIRAAGYLERDKALKAVGLQ